MARQLVLILVLMCMAPALAVVHGQASDGYAAKAPASGRAANPGAGLSSAAGGAKAQAGSASNSDCGGGPCPAEQPQIIVNSPPPAASPWTWHERVTWAANIVLAVLGYVGIMLALRMFRNIQRQTEASTATAQAALDTASTALHQIESIKQADRPWIVINIEPFLTMENSFKVMATNRGRTPARILSIVDRVKVATDEKNLPETPEYVDTESTGIPDPMILLPGESAGILAFSRDDVRVVCKTPEEVSRIELWEETIFLYGRIRYKDMISQADAPEHETSWCCRYIHGGKNSALVMAGAPAYNLHT